MSAPNRSGSLLSDMGTTTTAEFARSLRSRSSGYTVHELRSAAVALRAGAFTFQDAGGSHARVNTWCPSGRLTRVLAGHAGAGASTIALALADVAAHRGRAVRLIDGSSPAWSGLAGATGVEVGAVAGWRRGRRGDGLVIDRPMQDALTPAQVPVPPECSPVAMTVLDAGWARRELDAHATSWLSAVTPSLDVVVSRPNATALGQAEAAVRATETGACLLVVVGPSRRSAAELVLAGPAVRRLLDHQAVVHVPHVHRLAGLGPGPLPRALVSAAERLLDLIGDRISQHPDHRVGTTA